MKTTEIFVEQVIIGVLLLLVGGATLFGGSVLAKLDYDFGTSIVVVGAAYLSGIVYDRCADTLLADLEQHHRLWFAFKKPSGRTDDVFPEDEYRIHVLKCDNATDYVSYLRSRIRLTRALTTLAPAISVAAISLSCEPSGSWLRPVTLVLAVAAYALVLIAKCCRENGKPPKTYQIDKHHDYKIAISYGARHEPPNGGRLRFVLREQKLLSWTFVLLPVITALIWAKFSTNVLLFEPLILWPIVGLVLTLLCGWSWWRVSETFLRFLHDWHRTTKARDNELHQ